jgi:hypothetical protein
MLASYKHSSLFCYKKEWKSFITFSPGKRRKGETGKNCNATKLWPTGQNLGRSHSSSLARLYVLITFCLAAKRAVFFLKTWPKWILYSLPLDTTPPEKRQARKWRHDNPQNGNQHNDTQHNDAQHNGTQPIDVQHNGTQHNGIQYNNTQHNG